MDIFTILMKGRLILFVSAVTRLLFERDFARKNFRATYGIVQQFLAAFLSGQALFRADQEIDRSHMRTRTQQFFKQGFPQEAGGAGHEDHRLGEERVDGAATRLHLVPRVIWICLCVRRSHFDVSRTSDDDVCGETHSCRITLSLVAKKFMFSRYYVKIRTVS